MSSTIKRLREARYLTLPDLAEKTGLAEVDLKRLERKWDEPSPAVLRDLAIVLNCDVSDLIGQKPEPEQRDKWPYSVAEVEPDEFGGIYLEIAGKCLGYALSKRQKDNLYNQIEAIEVGNDRADQAWLSVTTMCGRLLFVNPAAVRSLSLKHDAEIATPDYLHPEVYRGLSEIDKSEGHGPVLTKAIAEAIDAEGEAAIEDQHRTKFLFTDGTEDLRYLHDESVASAIFSLDLASSEVGANSFLLVEREGGYVNSWINLSHVAMIDAPWEQYLRLTAAE
ncbi:XRE family transcriptional regulator [Sphingomonas sp. MA1305]|uniref:helix-turn-helix domain-containing protein n=1 Tax=Sphingomonas sp. MA1305 TaxID=2479204 RepID=UPI0018DFE274|nr:helix-turn-helix transcriptional regulator [Sphingomonas sp. MA1305]MBI0477489.1 XRE family transcriptional regulator [Sphingomonas sp. MA1305]